jgi:hypothetical protein
LSSLRKVNIKFSPRSLLPVKTGNIRKDNFSIACPELTGPHPGPPLEGEGAGGSQNINMKYLSKKTTYQSSTNLLPPLQGEGWGGVKLYSRRKDAKNANVIT